MARNFLTNLDMNGNQIFNLVLQQLGTDPISPSTGQVWYNSTTNQVKYYNGSTNIILYDSATTNSPSKLVLRDNSGNFAANVGTFNSVTINNTPSNATDAATKNYVDNVAQGLSPKTTARLATTTALPANTYNNGSSGVGATLTANSNGALSVDGVAVAVNDIILVKNESTQANNGLYRVTNAGSVSVAYVLTRNKDFDDASEIQGGFIFVGSESSTNAHTGWIVSSTGPYTIGTTAITFSQFTGLGDILTSTPLAQSGNTISLNFTSRLANNGGSLDLATSGVTAGTYALVTVDVYGRVTSAADITSGTGLVTKTASGSYTARSIASGTGISVSNGDGVSGNPTISIDTSVVPRKFNATITGDNATTAFAITHNLNTTAVIVQVRDSFGNLVETDNQANGVNTCLISFTVAPSNSTTYTVIVIG